jgi:pimeloyl-ACP methyl ester carboxylesterase|nr:alpha/beta hydrolase [Kofleriaceae bacterium]
MTAALYLDDSGGAGEPVVLLHSGGMSGGQWRRLSGELVAAGKRVLAVDLVGHGRSAPWPEPEPFSFEIDVDRVGELVRGLGAAHVVGHSYGGLIAMQVARRAPERIRTLAVFDPVTFGVLDLEHHPDPELSALDLASWSTEPEARERWLRTFVEFWSGAGSWSGLRREVADEFRRVSWVIHEGVRTLMADRTPASAYAAITAPALAMTGELSPRAAQRVVAAVAAALPHARHVTIAGAGHLAPVTHARDVNAHVLALLG